MSSQLQQERVERSQFYVSGKWVAPVGTDVVSVENPATEEIIGWIPVGSAADVDQAVQAARAALVGWSSRPPAERADLLMALHERLQARAGELARTISLELGAPARIASTIQTELPLRILRSYARLVTDVRFEQEVGNSIVVSEPVGVVGAITPWNYPLHQIVTKVAPALAAGCTVVLKPADLTPLVAFMLFDAVEEAGFPPGVLNLVTGAGPVVGEALARHPDVDMISFTGSTEVGRHVAAVAAQTVKKVALELGGKSANVILDDADLTVAVKVGVGNAFLNGGQTCTAWTRMLVHRDRFDEAVELAAAAAGRYTPGDPLEDTTRLGPLASAAQRDRVTGYVEQAIAEGATVVAGGAERPPGRGHYVQATVLTDVKPYDAVAQEEVFGPVLVVLPYEDEDDAVAIANDTVYGLAGGVWSADPSRAMSVARRLRAGSVDINGAPFNPLAPFGGVKQSGVGRELGLHGLEEFLQPKAIQR